VHERISEATKNKMVNIDARGAVEQNSEDGCSQAVSRR